MQSTLKTLPEAAIEFRIEVSPEDFTPYKERALKHLASHLELEGFRKGKVPADVAQKHLPEERIVAEAMEMAVQESYVKAVNEHEQNPIVQPEIKIEQAPKKEGDALIFTASTQVLPEMKLPDYRKIAAGCTRKKVDVPQKEIDDNLEWLRKSRAKRSQVERAAQKGDYIEVEYTSPQMKATEPQKDAFVLGEGRTIPGFEDNIVGMKANEEKQFSLTLPEAFHTKELAGKKADFSVKLTQVQELQLPELTDEFAQSVGKFKTADELKKSVTEGVTAEKEKAETGRFRQEILDKVAKKTSFVPPPALVQQEQQRMVHEMRHNVEQQLNVPFEQYLQQNNKTIEDVTASMQDAAKQRITYFLLLQKIAEAETIEPGEEQITDGVQKMMQEFQQKADPAHKDNLDPERARSYIREVLTNEKTLAFLEGLAKQPA